MTATLTDTANMRDEAAERSASLRAQLAASIRREDAYKSELATEKDELAKIRVECANLRCSANDLVAEMRETSADFGGALQAVVGSSNHSSEHVADKVNAEIDWAWKRVLSSLNMEYDSALRRICANVVRDDNEVLRDVACCTALISTGLDKIECSLPVEGVADTADA